MTSDASGRTVAPRGYPALSGLDLSRVLAKWAHARADTVFLRPFGGVPLTFAETHEEVLRLACALHGHGFRAGDAMLLRAGRRMEGFLTLLAAAHCGIQVCIAPEGMSARQVAEGAVSYAPKLAVDAGSLSGPAGDSLRIMEVAANLFTIRLVGCFGTPPDGLVDLAASADDMQIDIPLPDIEADGHVHLLRHTSEGKLQRVSRSQNQVLAQALLCAMAGEFSVSSVIGTPHDPLSPHGLLAAMIPALLVGCGVQHFDALDPNLAQRARHWIAASPAHRLVLPAAFAAAFAGGEDAQVDDTLSRLLWVSDGSAATGLPKDARLIVDCGGVALLPGECGVEGTAVLRPGAIRIAGQRGGPMAFGTLRLEAVPRENASAANLLSGEICVDSPLAARCNGRQQNAQATGQFARLAEDEARRPIYLLSDTDGAALKVGTHRVMLSAINRVLGLTGRWQDAAAFALPHPVLHHRIEVAVEPRAGDIEAKTLPTLEIVRAMLRESGIADAGLPVRLHLVSRVPRRGRSQVDVAALADLLLVQPADEGTLRPARQAVA